MDRRKFLQLSPAAATATASLTITEPGKEPVGPFGLSVLRVQPGDVVILSAPGCVSQECAARLRAYCEAMLPGTKWLVMSDGLRVDGVDIMVIAAEIHQPIHHGWR